MLLSLAEGRPFKHLISQQFDMKKKICALNYFHGAFNFTITEFLEKHYLFKVLSVLLNDVFELS